MPARRILPRPLPASTVVNAVGTQDTTGVDVDRRFDAADPAALSVDVASWVHGSTAGAGPVVLAAAADFPDALAASAWAGTAGHPLLLTDPHVLSSTVDGWVDPSADLWVFGGPAAIDWPVTWSVSEP